MPAAFDEPAAPAPDILEVSVFGPGRGECIVVHLGSNNWMIVDSCRNQAERSHPALGYLERIGVDVAAAVRLVVATQGTTTTPPGSGRYTPRRGRPPSYAPRSPPPKSSSPSLRPTRTSKRCSGSGCAAKYRAVFDEVLRRSPGPSGAGSVMHASPNRVLWPLPGKNCGDHAQVTALSPSDLAILLGRRDLARALGKAGQRRLLESIDPNGFSIGLWVSLGDHHALLGADLAPGPDGCGWSGILATWAPDAPGTLYKVAHHGSDTGDHPDIWTRLLAADPVAVIAPFRSGRTRLPKPSDVARIKATAGAAYITARPDDPARSRRVRATAGKLQGVATTVRDPWGVPGHVRARAIVGTPDWQVETFRPAHPL